MERTIEDLNDELEALRAYYPTLGPEAAEYLKNRMKEIFNALRLLELPNKRG